MQPDRQRRSWVNLDDTHNLGRYKEGLSPGLRGGQIFVYRNRKISWRPCPGICFPEKVGTAKNLKSRRLNGAFLRDLKRCLGIWHVEKKMKSRWLNGAFWCDLKRFWGLKLNNLFSTQHWKGKYWLFESFSRNNVMDKIWYRNPSESEVIGCCGGDEIT